MSRYIRYALIAVAVLAIVGGFWTYKHRATVVQGAWETELQAKSAAMNKDLPTQVDEETVLVSTTAKGNILEFRHSWPKLVKDDVDVDQTSSQLYATLRTLVCTSAEMKMYRDHGTTLQYTYYDKDGKYILGIKVETSTCP